MSISPFSFSTRKSSHPDSPLSKSTPNCLLWTSILNSLSAKQDQTDIDHIYVLSKGQLTYFHEKQGQRFQIGSIIKGDVLGGISLLMNGGVSMRSAEVYGKALCYLIPKGLFLDLCARNEKFYEYFIENYSKNMFDFIGA